MTALRVLLSIFLITSLAHSQTLPPVPEFKLTPIPAGDDKIAVVYEGKVAPYTGQLFSNETALRWGNYLQQCQVQVPLLLTAQHELYLTEIAYRDQVLVVEKEAADKVQKDLMARLERLEKKNAELQVELTKGPPWYASQTTGVILGVLGTLGVGALGAWAFSQ